MDGEFNSSSDTRAGVVYGSTFGAKRVLYSAIDGKAVFEGDIIIGTVAEMEALKGALPAVVITPDQFRWPDAIVPYEIEVIPKSKASPALATFADALHMVHLDDSANDLWHAWSTDQETWAADDRILGQKSMAAPALATFGTELHLVHLGDSSNNIWHSWTVDGRNWEPNRKIPGQQSKAPPALAAWDGALHLVHLGDSSNDIWHSRSTDLRTWSENQRVKNQHNRVQKSKASPALAAFNGELHMVHIGDSSNDLWHAFTSDGINWTEEMIPGQQSKAAPALAAFGGELHLVHLGKSSNTLWHSRSADGRNWSTNVPIPDQTSKAPAALAPLPGALHMVHLGDSSNRIWRSSTADGRKWVPNTHPVPCSRVLEAIRHWEERTPIRFVERGPGNAERFPNYVFFRESDACASAIGRRQTGRQDVFLAAIGCDHLGIVVHEIGHTVGLWHEQSREDRDQFVRIIHENIELAQEHNFDQHVTDGDDIGDYDFGSIMHYGKYAFSVNGEPTIVPLVEGVTIGQRDGLSRGDIAAVRFMYPG